MTMRTTKTKKKKKKKKKSRQRRILLRTMLTAKHRTRTSQRRRT
jgi:hypothetical protein